MEKLKQMERGSLYTVGWIAALSIELTAAIQMLDEQHDTPADYRPRPTDTNVYVWGRVGDHNVIIAFIEAGTYGTVPAATTATNLFGSFPSIRMCLLVGIGAGIRRKGFDVRLGDVVISQPDGKSGGVYQYDLQKAKAEGQFENFGILNRPSTLLLKVLARVQAHHDANPSKVPEYAKRITREMAPPFNEPGYVHQGLQNDRLFKSTFSHVFESTVVDLEDFDFDDSSTGEPSTTCPYCPPEEEVKRRKRPSGTDPQFHYGTIASGNTLVKDANTRNKIVAQVPGDCLCFEMEAAGMMNNFPCLVIRGICDYADSHKNDRWQPYAAITAAAYAREFLQFAPRGDVEVEQPLVEQLDDSGYMSF